MPSYRCHPSADPVRAACLVERLAVATLQLADNNSLHSELLFIHPAAISNEALAEYRFTQLIELNDKSDEAALLNSLNPTADDALVFNVSAPTAYRLRLSKLFLETLHRHRICRSGCPHSEYDLPLHEAITNATVHGNLELENDFADLDSMERFYALMTERLQQPRFANRRVVIGARTEGNRVELSVTDQGRGHRRHAPHRISSDAPHGRGFALMAGHADQLLFDNEGRTSRMAFHCGD